MLSRSVDATVFSFFPSYSTGEKVGVKQSFTSFFATQLTNVLVSSELIDAIEHGVGESWRFTFDDHQGETIDE